MKRDLRYQVGIDVGGTFTDFFVIASDGTTRIYKELTTPSEPSEGVFRGLEALAQTLGEGLAEFLVAVDTIVHGTTVTTNALLTGRGSKTGLITTAGFRDVLSMRDGTREESYNNRLSMPNAVVPRYLIRPVRERTNHKGEEITPVNAADVSAAAQIFRQENVEAIAVAFLHSPSNPKHEDEVKALLEKEFPSTYICTSSEILPQIRYYPRTSTVALNAYAGPVIAKYMRSLVQRLESSGFCGTLLIMQSNGGVARPHEIAKLAAATLLSGPAAGPTAGLHFLAPLGYRDCISVDMGGTSFDAVLVKDGAPLVVTDGKVNGWDVALPMVDIHTVGAGGGSIAWVDEGGLLHVGPQSAGADPGPAAYDRGGTDPTTTDADLVLGYIDPEFFAGGRIRMNKEAAWKAIETKVAKPLGISVFEAAAGIYRLINVNMANAIRQVSVKRGYDPREFPLVVAGGAGPIHGGAIASELEIPLIFLPTTSSVFCASGMLIADFKHDFVRPSNVLLQDVDCSSLLDLFDQMRLTAIEKLSSEGVGSESVSFRPSADMRYQGQWYEVDVPIEFEWIQTNAKTEMASAFHELHNKLYGYRSESPIELVNARLTVTGFTRKPNLEARPYMEALSDTARKGMRDVWSEETHEFVLATVYDGEKLDHGNHVSGPAVVELVNTNVVVPDGYDLVVDMYRNLVMYRKEAEAQYRWRFVQRETGTANLE